jgi:hypothetical protein
MSAPHCAWAHYTDALDRWLRLRELERELPLWWTPDIPRQLAQRPVRPTGQPHAPELAERIARLEERLSAL